MEYDVLVVGAGLSGAVIAECYANKLNKKVLIVDKREHIAGNCFDFKHPTGIIVCKYGAHIFHTSSEIVWEYVNRFTQFNNYKHKVTCNVGGKYVPMPVNIDTVNMLFDLSISSEEGMRAWLEQERVQIDKEAQNSHESAISRLGIRLYEMLFRNYTYKQWNMYPEELEASVMNRIPVRENFDPYYFSDKYEGIPVNGYTEMVKNMLDSKNIDLQLGVDFFAQRERLSKIGKIYFTGPIDQYFEKRYEPLQYRSLIFQEETLDFPQFQPTGVVNYPSLEIPFTRIVEHKHFYMRDTTKTVITKEFGTWKGDPYYPVPSEKNRLIYEKYANLAQKEKNVVFVGRLANYKYFNMDQAILNALNIFNYYEG